jgi:hypothetical protein
MTEVSKHLYNTKDVSRVRELLYEEQEGVDPITGLIIPINQRVLDHCHDTQYVRAVLHRQTNAVLGKIENLWTRYLSWWYTGTLSDFLRGCADYLEKEHNQEYIHPSFMKTLQVKFNKLNEGKKQEFLLKVNEEKGCNGTQRKVLFKKFLLKRTHTMKQVEDLLKEIQDAV